MRTTEAPSFAATRDTPPSTAGEGLLRVARVNGRSEVLTARATSPMKLLTPRSSVSSDASVVMSSYGGGLVSGDRLRLRVTVGDGARLRIGTQASTKVYRRTERGGACAQTINADVAAGATLIVAPDPVTCFAGAAYEQSQRFHLAPDASLLLVDWLTSGRWACGERWAFESYRSRTEISVAGRRVLLDAIRIDARHGTIDQPHRCGRFECLATVVLIGPAFAALAERILIDVARETVQRRGLLISAASPVRGGAILRVAGMGAEPVGRYVTAHLSDVQLWDRKW